MASKKPTTCEPGDEALVSVFVSGLPSASRILLISPGSSIVLHPTRFSKDSFEFEFAGSSGGSYTAVATTNHSLAQSNWIALGAATEVSPGQFRFTDSGATNHSQRFYGGRSP